MNKYRILAATPLLNQEEIKEFSNFGAMFMLLVLVIGICVIIFQIVRDGYPARKQRKEEMLTMRYDVNESILSYNGKKCKIAEQTIESALCRLVFQEPGEYQSDVDVLEEAGEDTFKERAVYFAVQRINIKSKNELNLKDDLLKRGKQKSALNDFYV